MKKLSNTEAELKKNVAYKKKRVNVALDKLSSRYFQKNYRSQVCDTPPALIGLALILLKFEAIT